MKFTWLARVRDWMANSLYFLRPYLVQGFVTTIFIMIALGGALFISDFGEESGDYKTSDTESSTSSLDGCNVLGINIHGCIATYAPDEQYVANGGQADCDALTSAEKITGLIEQASNNEHIQAILLDVDSTGGQPQAAVEIADMVKSAGIPSVAWIRGYGDSAAYWIASAATTIIASKESDIGSIGVTSSYVDNAKQNNKEGYTYNSLSTGKYKDLGNPDKPLTADERALIEKGNAITLEHFIATVAENRGLSIEKVRAMADGSSVLGEEALSKGLIDSLGTYKVVMAKLKEIVKDEPIVCWPDY